MSTKRKIEVFSAGCPVCEEMIELIHGIAWGNRVSARSNGPLGSIVPRASMVRTRTQHWAVRQLVSSGLFILSAVGRV